MEKKFRAWDKIYKKMLYDIQNDAEVNLGYYLNLTFHDADPILFEKGHMDTRKVYDVMQYTGLKDKNGKEIYEGDIVFYERTEANHVKGKIEFEHGRYLIITDDGYSDLGGTTDFIRIIGNVYENPELLEKEK